MRQVPIILEIYYIWYSPKNYPRDRTLRHEAQIQSERKMMFQYDNKINLLTCFCCDWSQKPHTWAVIDSKPGTQPRCCVAKTPCRHRRRCCWSCRIGRHILRELESIYGANEDCGARSLGMDKQLHPTKYHEMSFLIHVLTTYLKSSNTVHRKLINTNRVSVNF